jgi:hypothetical protein
VVHGESGTVVSDPVTTVLVGAGPPDRPPSGIARHVSRVAAWSRLEDELRSIAVDLLGPNETDELPAGCAEWVAATTEKAISGVCDEALDGLVQALESLLVDVPLDIARQLDEARIRHDAGYN